MKEASERPYPRRNPFPITATASQDERPAGPSAPGKVLGQPTVPLPAVEKVWKATRDFLRLSAEGAADRGQLVYVHGDHGAGKTHAVLHALERVPEVTTEHYRFYVKAEDDDFIALYQRLMGQLDLAAFRDISLRFLGTIASEQIGKSLGGDAAAKSLTQVRNAPEQVYALYENLTVEPGAVLQQQAAELAGFVNGREDFQRAVAYLLDPVLQGPAHAWLVGRDITADETSRLGVSGPIREPHLGRYGIQLLVAMGARIGRPVIIMLDQCERLIFDRDNAVCPSNVGLLHSLVETVPQANGMLVLVSSNEAWLALPRDFRQRIGHDVPALSLTPDQAIEVLATYIGIVTRTVLAGDPYPFTDQAVRVLLELSGGNIRRMLQQAWEVLDQAPPDRLITPAFVEKTADRGRGRITEADARLGIEGALFGANLTFDRNWQLSDIQADYAVPAGSSPRVLIQISQAAFADDEAQQALRHANLTRQVQLEGLTAQVVLVVLGYCSPDVLAQLERVAHEVIVYDGPGAAERLQAILTASPGPQAPEPADDAAVSGAIDALQQAVAVRDQEVSQLRADISQLLDRFTEAAEPAGRGAWKQRLQQLRDQIRDERKERRRQEFADLEAAHARAERDRRTRYLIGAAAGLPPVLLGASLAGWSLAAGQALAIALMAAGAAAIAPAYARGLLLRRLLSPGDVIAVAAGWCTAGIGVYVLWQAGTTYSSLTWYGVVVPVIQGMLITLGVLIAGACALVGFSVLETGRNRELGRPADSIERLNQAARSYVGKSRSSLQSRRRIRELLRHYDPHYRYAGVTGMRLNEAEGGWGGRVLAGLFLAEPTTIIRRAAARKLGTASAFLISSDVSDIVRDGTEAGVPETVYLVEAVTEGLARELAATLRPDSPAGLLARVRDGRRDPASLLATVVEIAAPEGPEGLADALRNWYRDQRDVTSHSIPERFLRRAAAMVSPFETAGLGTFDELALIPDIDEVYLFLEELIFYRERGPLNE